jgi:hypothetical protein
MTTTSFDHLPTEIVYLIFDYLSNNDILYTFFFFNQRFNSLILENQRYLSYLELPSTDLEMWKRIISVIDSQIECLNIMTNDFSSSLESFPNLRSLVISFPHGLSNEEWKLIIEREQFRNLKSFKIVEDKLFFDDFSNVNFPEQDNLFEKIFSNGNRLERLTIPTFYLNNLNNLNVNFNLHSIRLNLIIFEKIFILIKFTPNLKYLS